MSGGIVDDGRFDTHLARATVQDETDVIAEVDAGTPRDELEAVFASAPNPNAARLLFAWIMSGEGQEFIVNLSGQYPANRSVKAKAGRPPLSSIKTLPEDPVAVEKAAEEIKARYAKIFKV